MADQEFLSSDVHPEAILLPWYLNGTLRDEERQAVSQHLATCGICRAELEGLAQLRLQIKEVYSAQPGPSTHTARSVIEQVREEAAARKLSTASRRNWLDGLDNWFRSLLLPRWAPTLAATVFIGQLGLLFWVMHHSPVPDQVMTRSLSPPMIRLRVVFQENASEQQIRSVVQGVGGRIIDGPSQDGAYIIETPAGDQTSAQSKLDTMQGHRDIVRLVEIVQP